MARNENNKLLFVHDEKIILENIVQIKVIPPLEENNDQLRGVDTREKGERWCHGGYCLHVLTGPVSEFNYLFILT